jgi:hypothetical protein
MERICKVADQLCAHIYVLASPAGVNLYSKFDFETVGQIVTEKGIIKSMLRKAPATATTNLCSSYHTNYNSVASLPH